MLGVECGKLNELSALAEHDKGSIPVKIWFRHLTIRFCLLVRYLESRSPNSAQAFSISAHFCCDRTKVAILLSFPEGMLERKYSRALYVLVHCGHALRCRRTYQPQMQSLRFSTCRNSALRIQKQGSIGSVIGIFSILNRGNGPRHN